MGKWWIGESHQHAVLRDGNGIRTSAARKFATEPDCARIQANFGIFRPDRRIMAQNLLAKYCRCYLLDLFREAHGPLDVSDG
ncbi:hypothetical protein D3P04_02560 [Paracoccus onubensis]|uniref:Uncharacterized protein n=1 Tax=Paracoccus onubensis TaxID=1675788 RepID=A0A418T3N3_9RHOB|nr:hypothetical protein D3P04_02560 [Paracoccus onubensis]